MGGSKKHKKHKSERRDKYDDFQPSLKLILKVGKETPESGSSQCQSGQFDGTPGHSPPSGAFAGKSSRMLDGNGSFNEDYPEKHKKSKKKKKKKDREKKHKHHKEKRHRHRDDSSQEDVSFGEDNSIQLQENILHYVGITTDHSPANRPISKPIVPMKLEEVVSSPASSPSKSVPELALPMTSPGAASTPGTASTPGSVSTMGPASTPGSALTPKPLEAPKTPSSCSESGREPRTCVLKLKQSKSPLTKLLDHLLRSLEKRDPHQFFAWPVTDDIAPGYSTIITKPMDFSTMRQKIEDNEYSTLQEFEEDFRLMCENAIRYNHVETVYHKAAKRLLHLGAKLLLPESLMRSLKPLSGYMRELTPKELGFELPTGENQDHDHQIVDSADEGASTGADEPTPAQLEEEEKRRAIRAENDPKSHFEPFVDDLTSEEILAQVQNAARMVKKRLTAKQKAHKMGFLRQTRDGTTSLKILLDGEEEGPERVVSLGDFTGKLSQGTGQLQGFREDRRNTAKIVKPLNYGTFSSFAPVFDSRFSNLSKEETELVLSTYGDETGVEYTESIMEFSKDSTYATILANRLLDILTQGEHMKTVSVLYESQRQAFEEEQLKKTFPEDQLSTEEEYKKFEHIKIDFNNLKTLSDLGIDTTFLPDLEQSVKTFELQKKLQEQLTSNLSLIEQLHSTQHERLSQPLPPHLTHVARPSPEEIQLANQISSNLTAIAKQVPPNAISEPHSLRKAMGMSNVGLPQLPQPRLVVPTILQEPLNPITSRATDTTQVPMEIETDSNNANQTHTSVDLESELREFLENGSGLTGSHADDNSIEQMLLD